MRAKEFLIEGYREVEFVCANSSFDTATDTALQKALYKKLKTIPGVIPLWQDWSSDDEQQLSLTAIFNKPEQKRQILQAAKELGVAIDLIQPVADDYVNRALRGEHEGQITEDKRDVLGYVKQTHHNFTLDDLITRHDDWELKTLPIDYFKHPDEHEDPYNRIIDIDLDHVDTISKRDIDSKPIVADNNGFVLDGNHRLEKARKLGMTHVKAWVPKEQINEAVTKTGSSGNIYDYEWDANDESYHVTKNGARIGASYKAKSKFDAGAADEAAKKHAKSLKNAEIAAEKKAREHGYQYNKPLSDLEKQWVELDKKMVQYAKTNTEMPDHELKKYLSYGQAVRKSLLDHSHPAMSHRPDHKPPLQQPSDLDEGVKDWITAAGIGMMAAGGGGAAYDAYKARQSVEPQAQVQQYQAELPQKKMGKMEGILANAAQQAGIVGTELKQFLAQCAHESANFSSLEEIGTPKYFARKYDKRFAPGKAKILGNIKPGDGAKYKGRGFIQLTGRYNYAKAGQALGLPLEKQPELAARPDIAAKIAVWFWQHRVQPQVQDFADVPQSTKPINPGMAGLKSRQEKYDKYAQYSIPKPERKL